MHSDASAHDENGPIGIALVGAGRMGAIHLRALPRARRVRLRAICDPAPAAAALGELAGVPVDTAFEQTLRRVDVHAVLIAAPTPLHETLVTAALAAGKHALCEKPLTFQPEADLRLAAQAEREGLCLHVGFWRRHAWPYREARRLIAEGTIGRPRLLRLAQWDAELPPAAFCDPAVSGGIELDCGVHECDLAAWLCGSPVAEAFARGAPTRGDIAAVGDVESLAGLLVLAAGQPVTLDLARTAAHADIVRSEIVGEHGSLICEAHGAGAVVVRTDDALRELAPPTDDVLLDALARQIDALAEAAAGGPAADAARPPDAAAALRAALALRESRRSGAPVTL
ncbi:MAG: myo-inositol 2-dehydrogenase / D-chiro-inositol 1-dehydrogenase [Gaiellales bacterium]|nr:myo-inositol 2-dehydrogenase / D-chiro-inositol 1-dehydrogenase [Gaiellales bacterium]